jgi:hypothetical protein
MATWHEAVVQTYIDRTGDSRSPASASTTRSNYASDFALSDSQPVKSAASLDLTCSTLPLCQSPPAHRSKGRPTP